MKIRIRSVGIVCWMWFTIYTTLLNTDANGQSIFHIHMSPLAIKGEDIDLVFFVLYVTSNRQKASFKSSISYSQNRIQQLENLNRRELFIKSDKREVPNKAM